jgi:general secretion pathway protein A
MRCVYSDNLAPCFYHGAREESFVDAYERHFGFQEPPFSVTPDPRFFFANPAYREAFSTLRYGVEARKGFILVSGEAGTGKTTLLRMLMQHADSGIQTAFVFNPPGSFTELLQAVLNELELPQTATTKAAMIERFNDYLLDQFKEGHIVAVLIDEAQTLSQEMLEQIRLLSNLEARNAKLVQIVLMGQPELEERLDRPELRQLKQRVALRCRIHPLCSEDVGRYIQFRLSVAGYEGEALFNGPGIEKIALYSQGIPRLINVLCDNALLRACRDGAKKVSVKVIDEAARDLRLDMPPPSPIAAASKETLGNPFAQTSRNTAHARYGPPVWREHIDWPTLGFGLWFIAIILVAAGLVRSLQESALRLTTVDSHIEESTGAGRANSPQGDKLVDPEASVGLRTDTVAGTPPSPVRHQALGSRRSESGESLAAPGNLPTTPRAGQEIAGSDDYPKGEGSERGRSRVVVRLGQEKTVRLSGRANQRQAFGIFNVVGASLVRDKPTADADMMGSFQPGTRVRVTGKAGDYLRVQGLDGPMISGYVHVEDAFFEPSR